MERNPEAFFSLTYPSLDIRSMLQSLSHRYGPTVSDISATGQAIPPERTVLVTSDHG